MIQTSPPPQWSRRRAEKARRLERVRHLADGALRVLDRVLAEEGSASAQASEVPVP